MFGYSVSFFRPRGPFCAGSFWRFVSFRSEKSPCSPHYLTSPLNHLPRFEAGLLLALTRSSLGTTPLANPLAVRRSSSRSAKLKSKRSERKTRQKHHGVVPSPHALPYLAPINGVLGGPDGHFRRSSRSWLQSTGQNR